MKRQVIVVLLIVCLMNLSFIGCSDNSGVNNSGVNNSTGDAVASEPLNSNELSSEGLSTQPIYSYIQESGTEVDIYSVEDHGDYFVCDFQCVLPDKTLSNCQKLKISKSMSEVEIRDANNVPISRYEIGEDVNGIFYEFSEYQTEFDFNLNVNGEKISFMTKKGQESHSIEFENQNELELAAELYTDVVLNNEQRDLNTAEEALLSLFQEWVDFTGYEAPTWFDDISSAQYILADDGVQGIISPIIDDDQEIPIARSKLCGWVSLISIVTCTFMLVCWVLVIVCIPSLGFALACALADIIE